jgi:hypothetical protein
MRLKSARSSDRCRLRPQGNVLHETALASARAELGTATMKETVNEALRSAGAGRISTVREALDRLGRRELPAREEACQRSSRSPGWRP